VNKVVIDTNVFVSSFFGGIPRAIIDLWKNGVIQLCLSQEIIAEYLVVLNRLGLRDQHELRMLTRLFAEGYNSIFASQTPKLSVVRDDPADDKFIECAVALDCRVIISGDRHLLSVKKYVDIDILSPREYIETYQNS